MDNQRRIWLPILSTAETARVRSNNSRPAVMPFNR
jgi:hypothetical protein